MKRIITPLLWFLAGGTATLLAGLGPPCPLHGPSASRPSHGTQTHQRRPSATHAVRLHREHPHQPRLLRTVDR